jgi:hypothetical protein
VLEQRVPIARVPLADVLAIVATVHAVFPNVRLYEHRSEVAVVACATACPGEGGEGSTLLLDPPGVDALVRDLGATTSGNVDALVLHDDDSALDMTSVQGNDFDATRSRDIVREALARYASRAH